MKEIRNKTNGFTLLELMVAVAVVAILATIAIPSFTYLFSDARVRSANDAVLSAIAYARSTAVDRNATITLCPSNSAFTACDGTDWTQGWIAVDSSDTVLRAWEQPNSSVNISLTNDQLAFEPTGMLDSSITSNIEFNITVNDNERCYEVLLTGIVVQKDECSDTD